MSTSSVSNPSTNVEPANLWSPSAWCDHFDQASKVTAADLGRYRVAIDSGRYPKYPAMVLWLARAGKLRPKVLIDAAYIAWLKTENPKRAMCADDWAEMFRLARRAQHELAPNTV